MTSQELIAKSKKIADSKTMYIKKGKGQYLSDRNKLWLSGIDPFNAKNSKKIFDASEDTHAYDEFGFFSEISGFNCRNIGEIMALCDDISKDFTTIKPGELVFMGDRFGIFIGKKKVISVNCVGVGYTILDNSWVSHGKLNDVEYLEEVQHESSLELQDDGTGSGDRVQQVPSQDKGYDRGYGRRKS